MFDHLVSSNNLLGEFEKYGLTEQDRNFIKEQIAGPRKHIQKVQIVSYVSVFNYRNTYVMNADFEEILIVNILC